MADVEIEGRVIGIAADSYVIDIGVSLGSSEGSYFLVFSEGGDVYDANDRLIGTYKIPQAVVRAKNVSTAESVCEIALPSKEWVIQVGDGVVPIRESSAHKLKFATYRTSPDAPNLQGYNGRWVRLASPEFPVSAIVKYFVPWSMPDAAQGFTMAQPGYYYMEFPILPPVVAGMTPPPPQPGYARPEPAPPAQEIQPAPPLLPEPPQYRLNRQNYVLIPDFDVNRAADAKLIATFPLTQVEIYALEIEHRRAYALYESKRYREALDAFSNQSLDYLGNYLSPYWAGKTALKLNENGLARSWFERALHINPLYQPAIDALKQLDGAGRPRARSKG
jgi:hypothetical protein